MTVESAHRGGGGRILVVLEAAEDAGRLEVAAALARGLRFELTAVLIDQQPLFDLARLPLAREVRRLGGAIEPLRGASLVQAARRREALLKARLEKLSLALGLSCSLTQVGWAGGALEWSGLRQGSDVVALSPDLIGFAGAEVLGEGPLLITPTRRPAALGGGPVAWVTEDATENDSGPPEVAEQVAAALERPLRIMSPSQVRAGRYGGMARPSLLLVRGLRAPLDGPRGLLMLAREIGCPVLSLPAA